MLPILRGGGAARKLFCVSGAVARPGVYEVVFGVTLGELLELAGGVPEGRQLQAVLLGGAAGSFVGPDELDMPLTIEGTRARGATLGSGVVLVLDDSVSLVDQLKRIAAFFRDESCGQCVPCRVGTVRQEEALARLAAGAGNGDVALLGELAQVMPRCQHLWPRPDRTERHHVGHREVRSPPVSGATVSFELDGREVTVPEGTTILAAARGEGTEVPTLCYGDTITPKNACRVCMVEVEGSRVLVPSCSRTRRAGDGRAYRYGSHAAQPAARARAVGVVGRPLADCRRGELERVLRRRSRRFGPPSPPVEDRDSRTTGHHDEPTGEVAETVDQPVKVDNPLYVRDYAKCILCYQCVDACGEQWQQTWAIGVAGRGFDARISTEYAVDLPDSACVYCGNCIQVCPTGALMFTSEHEMRAEGTWDEDGQTRTDTICPYCGVGCTLTLHVQDGQIVKVTSPSDSDVTHGNLCVKGRFGFQHVQNVPKDDNGSVD